MRPYLAKTKPIAPTRRVPWYRYAAPCYLSLFLWIGYYDGLSGGTVNRADLGLLVFGLVVAGAICHWLLYSVPATMGMQTGYPAGVLGSATFGSKGGVVVPGLLIGAVQTAWLGVASHYAAKLVVAGAGLAGGANTVVFLLVAGLWSFAFAFVGTGSLAMLSRLALACIVPFAALLYGLFQTSDGIVARGLGVPQPYAAVTLIIHLATGFFATTAAISPALGRHSPSRQDLRTAGWVGIIMPGVLVGTLAIVTVAGGRALVPDLGTAFGYLDVIGAATGATAGLLIPFMLLIGSIPASGFIAWMSADSLGVMLPDLQKRVVAVIVAVGSWVVAVSGIAGNIQVFITFAAALCAPLCGIAAADYWQHDKRWPHSRPGINYAGYGAWLAGCVVGIVPLLPIPEHILNVAHPASVFAFAMGFAGYIVLGNMGLKPYRKHRRKRVRMNSWEDETPEAAEWRRQRLAQAEQPGEHADADDTDDGENMGGTN